MTSTAVTETAIIRRRPTPPVTPAISLKFCESLLSVLVGEIFAEQRLSTTINCCKLTLYYPLSDRIHFLDILFTVNLKSQDDNVQHVYYANLSRLFE